MSKMNVEKTDLKEQVDKKSISYAKNINCI